MPPAKRTEPLIPIQYNDYEQITIIKNRAVLPPPHSPPLPKLPAGDFKFSCNFPRSKPGSHNGTAKVKKTWLGITQKKYGEKTRG